VEYDWPVAEDYNDAYARAAGLFGNDPEEVLVRCVDALDQRRPVLDVGCGQGRNSLWLAEKGFDVVALDPSEQATQQLAAAAANRGLAVDVRHGGVDDFGMPDLAFGGVCVFGLIQILTRKDIAGLVAAIDRWTAVGSALFVTAWTVADPSYAEIASRWSSIGESSFLHADGRVRTFLREGEILELFPGYEAVLYREGLGPWHRHGDGPEERHARVELVARRIDG